MTYSSRSAGVNEARRLWRGQLNPGRDRVAYQTVLLKLVGCEERPNRLGERAKEGWHEEQRMNSAEHREEGVRWGHVS